MYRCQGSKRVKSKVIQVMPAWFRSTWGDLGDRVLVAVGIAYNFDERALKSDQARRF